MALEASPLRGRNSGPPLELVVGVVGASSLGAEIAAARLLAPWFGASTIVWANTIATVLVALSGGYYPGGRPPARAPAPRRFLPGRPARRPRPDVRRPLPARARRRRAHGRGAVRRRPVPEG